MPAPISSRDYKTPEGLTSGDVCHFKGFASRMNFSDEKIAAAGDAVVAELNKWKAVVWDGDSFEDTSFTYLIPRINKDVILIAFKREEEIADMMKSWAPTGIAERIIVYACDNSISYTELGFVALGMTKATDVLCFGGGQTVLNECTSSSSEVVFRVVDVTRPNGSGDGFERCSLLQTEVNFENVALFVF